MKRNLTLTIVLLLFSLIRLHAQCNNPNGFDYPSPPGTSSCEAVSFCNGEINGYCGQLGATNVTWPSPLCGGNGVPNNMEWLAFVAAVPTITVTVTPFNCPGAGTVTGVQAGLYTACEDEPGDPVPGACQPICQSAPFTLNANNLVVGNVYYLFIDGCAGDQCSYTLATTPANATALPPIGTLGPISGYTNVCPGAANIQYSVPLLFSAVGYTWTVPPGWSFSQSGNTIVIDFPANATDGQICVEAYNDCFMSNQNCLDINVSPPPTGADSGEYCPGLTYIYPGDNQNYTDGFYTITLFGENWLGCDSMVNLNVTELYTSEEFIEAAICAGEEYDGACGIPYDFEGQYEIDCNPNFVGCDSTIILDLYVLEPMAVVETPGVLGCGTNTSIYLDAFSSFGDEFLWETTNGIICDDPTLLFLEVCAPGIYCLTATSIHDYNSGAQLACTDQVCVTVTENAVPPNSNFTSTPAGCPGQSNGTATITVSNPAIGPFTYTWVPQVSISNTATNLAVGTYNVTITAQSNGCTSTEQIVIASSPPITAPTSQTNIACNGGSTGTATVSPGGGSGGFTYLWCNGQTSQTATGLSVGTCGVTVTDGTGCTNTASVTITQASAMAVSITPTNVLCNGGTSGSATASASGGTGPYTYLWSNSQTGGTATNLSAGSYTVTATDALGCTSVQNTTLVSPPAITLTTSQTNLLCNGNTNGTATANPGGGVGGFTYSWCNGQTTAMATGLPSGSCQVVVTDGNGCTAASTVTITAPNPVSVSATSTNVNCFGVSDGTATATVSGGTGSPSYQWCNGQSTATATGLGVGACSVTVTDGNGCTAVASVTLTGPATALSVTGTSTNASCGTNNGTVNITVSGGTPTYTYAWSNNSTTQNLSGVGPGGYTVTVTDNNDCTAVFSTTVNTPSGLQATTSATAVSCNGGTNGTVSVTVSGGSAPFTYAWTGGIPANQTMGTNLAAGNYNVTVTDDLGCTFVSSATVTQPTAITIAGNSTDENCGEGDGTISTNVQGGSGPYQYAWAPSGTGANPTGLSAGNYSLTVTDANGCTATFYIPVNTPGALLVNAVGTAAACNGEASGSIATTVTGGVGPYDYAWAGGLGATEDPNNVPAGSYNLVVTDDTGCSVTTSVTIGQPTALAATSVSNQATCGDANGSISLTVTGGSAPYSYDWSNNNTTANPNNLAAGNYTVTISDNNDCELIQSVIVTTPPPLALTITSMMASCFGGTNGSINLGVTGGTAPYTYIWTGGSIIQDPTNLAAGNYQVTVTDNNDCTETISVQVGQPTQLNFQSTSTSASCGQANGSITSLASGGTPGYTYAWSGGAGNSQNPNSLSPGSYVGTVTDANGCTATTTVDVLTPAGLSSNNAVTDVSCNGDNDGAVNLEVMGGVPPFTYQWSNGPTTQDLNNLSANTYDVTITDATGCTIVASATVTQPNAILITSSIIEASCGEANGGISLTVTGGSAPYTYLWSNAATNQNPTGLTADIYTVTVSDANDCESIESVQVTEPNAPQLTATATMASCFGEADGSIDLEVSGGVAPFQYAWTGGSILQDPSNLAAGIYNAVVTDDTGCSVTISIEVEEPQELIVSGNAMDALCGDANGSITSSTVGGTAPYSYTWSGGAASVPNPGGLFPGTYVATVTDGNGCTTTFSIDVETPTGLSFTTAVIDVACNGATGGAVDLEVFGGVSPFSYTWDYNNINIADLNNVPAGNYAVTVTDATGCTIIGSALVSEPAAIVLSETIIEATCGEANGGISLSVVGGVAPYTFDWSNSSISQNPTGLLAGDYDVIVTDANGCTASLSTTVTTPSALTASATQSNVSCNGGSDGSVNITVQGGTQPYTYLWNGSITAEDPTNLAAGAVTGVVTDANGCETSVTVTLQEPSAIVLDATTEDATCGEANGSIDLSVSGGTGPYTYDWDNAPDVQDPGAVLTGSYTVVVSDINGCTESYTTLVNTPNALVLSAVVTDSDCNGASTGSINLTVNGGVAPYSYDWPGWNGEDLSDIAAGSYTVIVTDATDCSVSLTEIVSEPTAMMLSGTSTVALCGQNNGTINLTVTGGTSPYSYLWSNADTTEDPINLGIGNYTVIVTDANQCTAVEAIMVSTPSGLALEPAFTDVSCNGGADGTASVTVSGGTPPFTYLWSNGETTAAINGLSIGTVTCTVTDFDGCEVVSSSVIAEPTQININGNTTQATCGNANGTVTIAVSGGTSPYSFAWSNGSTNQNPNQLLAGPITVTVTDDNGCTMVGNFTVGTPPALTGVLSPTNVSCNGGSDGSISPAIFGGAGPYDYLWTPGGSTIQIPTDFAAGVYTLLVTDANGCTLSLQETLSEPAALDVTGTSTDALCGESDGTVDITVTGGTTPYSYVWSNGPTTPDLPGVSAGSYTVTVTDANDCEFIYDIIVNTPSMLSAFTIGTDALCFGSSDGMATSTVTGGSAPFTYEWSNGYLTEDLLDVTAGNYILSVTDATGCTVTANVTIGQPTALGVTGEPTDALCNSPQGTVTISVTGGTTPYSYMWSNGEATQNIINLSADVYTVTVTDGNGCTATNTEVVSIPNAVQINSTVEDANCNESADGSINVETVGGIPPFTYEWSNGATTQDVSSLSAGDYVLTITDGNNCDVPFNITVGAPPVLTAEVLGATDLSCNGDNSGSIDVTVTGGTMPYNYNWDNAPDVQNPVGLSAGTYNVTVTDANGCTALSLWTLTQPEELVLNALSNSTLCSTTADGSINLSVSGGTVPFEFDWTNGSTTEDVNNLTAGTYNVIVTDANGCTESLSETVDAPEEVALSISALSDYAGVNVSCNNSSDGFATVQPTGGVPPYSYQWSNGDTNATAENLGAGSYTVTATDANGCPGEIIVSLEGPEAIFVAAVAHGVTCFGDANGVILVDSIAGGATPFTYALNGGSFNQHGLFANLLPGSYELTVQDANGCEEVFTQTVESAPELQVFINGDSSIRLGQQIDITATFNVLDVSTLQQSAWVNGSFWVPDVDGTLCDTCLTRTIRPLETTTYEYLIVDEDGCIGRDELVVRVLKDRAVYIPNAFSPNGDGNNEFLLIYPGPEVANINFFKIYNRWGEVVYELSDFFAMAPDEGWDGRFKGDMMNPGVFVYHAQVVFWDGRVELLKGDITLFR